MILVHIKYKFKLIQIVYYNLKISYTLFVIDKYDFKIYSLTSTLHELNQYKIKSFFLMNSTFKAFKSNQ